MEIRWYEAHGIGGRALNIKRYLDEPPGRGGTPPPDGRAAAPARAVRQQRRLRGVARGAEVLRRAPGRPAHGQLRVVDESGADYLYPAARFTEVLLPLALRLRLPRTA